MTTDKNVTKATQAEEARDAKAAHAPDRPPTPSEEAVAEKQALPDGTAEHYKEMTKTGADVQGEGQIEP
jgi:hypothetical protein